MGSIFGHRIDHNGVGAVIGQQHIPRKKIPQVTPPPPRRGGRCSLGAVNETFIYSLDRIFSCFINDLFCTLGKLITDSINDFFLAMNECEKKGLNCPPALKCVKQKQGHECGCNSGFKVVGGGNARTCKGTRTV